MTHHNDIALFGTYEYVMLTILALLGIMQIISEKETVKILILIVNTLIFQALKDKVLKPIFTTVSEILELLFDKIVPSILEIGKKFLDLLLYLMGMKFLYRRLIPPLIEFLLKNTTRFAVWWITSCDNAAAYIRRKYVDSGIYRYIVMIKSMLHIPIPGWLKKTIKYSLFITSLGLLIYYLYSNQDTEAVMKASAIFTDSGYITFLGGLLIMAMSAAGGIKIGNIKLKPDKVLVLFIMFLIMSYLYIHEHGLSEYIHLLFHSDDHGHKKVHLPFEMIQLFLGFELFEWITKKSGLSRILGRVITSIPDLLWAVFIMSSFMDNILMALVGAAIVVTVWKGIKNVPLKILIAVIVAANLGGAWSFIGDTTTIIIYLQRPEATAAILANCIFGALASHLYWVWYGKRNIDFPEADKDQIYLITPMLWVIGLGLIGIITGNILFHQPGIGLLLGIFVGFVRMRIWKYMSIAEGYHALKNGGKGAIFITLILLSADLLDLEILKPLLFMMSADAQAFALGMFSGILDNIPLTSLATMIGGYDWALLAYAVGFGGSMFFFSSSAGIAVAMSYPKVANSKAWLPHTLHVIIAFVIGFFVQLLFREYIFEIYTTGLFTLKAIGSSCIFLGIYIILAYNLKIVYGPGRGILTQKKADLIVLKKDLKIIRSSEEYHALKRVA